MFNTMYLLVSQAFEPGDDSRVLKRGARSTNYHIEVTQNWHDCSRFSNTNLTVFSHFVIKMTKS